MNVIAKYFEHLASNPERIDSLLIWFVCVAFCWFWLVKYRERLITGLEGENKLWEGGEQFVWLMQLMTPPIVFYFLCFVPDSRIYVLIVISGIIAFTVGGRWLLLYGLTAAGKASVKDLQDEEKQTEAPK